MTFIGLNQIGEDMSYADPVLLGETADCEFLSGTYSSRFPDNASPLRLSMPYN